MSKKMLIDATHEEETRVAVVDSKNKLLEYDYESQARKPLKGSVFLAKVTRVEPSLQAAFVNFGGNRHGFLPFSEIHPDYFRIPIADREALLEEQRAAMEAAAKAAEEEDREDEEAAAREEGDVEEDAEQEEIIDEVGGETKDPESEDEEQAAEQTEESDDDEAGDTDEEADEETIAEGAEDSQDASDSDEETNEGSEGEDDPDADGNRRGGRGRRGRGRGRNRGGRGRGRRAHNSRRVEVLGGEEYDDDGGNRFRFDLRRRYKIQEVIKRGQIMLVQASREERGNKGAAVSSYLSLPGRYCVLMPNSPRGGGVSRKIASYKDRARMREILRELNLPEGMSVIVRTAGVARTKAEIKRDLDYLMRLWNQIREDTLESSAPAMIYEEADLIKRSIRDLYTRDIDEVIVSGEEGFKQAKGFMKLMIPSHVKRVIQDKEDALPLFNRYKVEKQIADIGEPSVELPSGGYLVINPTEALVSVDVNSGRATKERHIEETALKTNLEAAEEVARQLRLRDLGGLVVIDFIDMDDRRNNGKVERRLKESLSGDRARIQVGRISSFGLLEMSRQRLNPSITEAQFETCPHCQGIGLIRSVDGQSILVMRAIEEEGTRKRAAELVVHVNSAVALYVLNNKRKLLTELEKRYGFEVVMRVDDTIGAEFRVEVSKPLQSDDDADEDDQNEERDSDDGEEQSDGRRRGRRGRRGGRNRRRANDDVSDEDNAQEALEETSQEKPQEDKAEEKPKAKRGRRKKSEEETEEKAEEQVNEAAVPDVADEPEEKPKAKRGRKKKVEEPAQEVSEEKTEELKEEKPKAKRGRKKKVEEKVEEAAEEVSNDAAPATPVEDAPKDYETVNEAPEKKRKGWWNKLTS